MRCDVSVAGEFGRALDILTPHPACADGAASCAAKARPHCHCMKVFGFCSSRGRRRLLCNHLGADKSQRDKYRDNFFHTKPLVN